MCQTNIYYCFEKLKMDIENILKVDIKDEQDTPDRNLVCITFPGIVKNDANAIKCLGGLKGLSQVYSHSLKKRLGLSFNPDNPYVKKIYGDCKNIPGILFKVKVKKTRVGNEIKREVISTTVVGRVEKTFKFDSMSDFQYLPISDEPATSNKCLVEKCLPSGLDSVDYMEEPAPLFLLPGHFTRTDKPTNYEYIEKRQNNVLKKTNLKDDEDSHNRMRADRKGPGINITFDLVRDFPTEAHEHHIKIRDTSIFINSVKKAQYETVRKLFEERPIWSHNLIRYKTHIKGTTLKPMLPCLAFYLNNGPWKKLWIRHGYDPRKDPESRKYQTLDFRFRSEAAIRSIITCRDDTVHGRRGGVDTYNLSLKRPGSAAPEPDVVHESSVIVRPGLVPMQRQMYYQYVDVLLPEVQAKLAEPPAPGMLCHQTRGWLPPDAELYCRQIIYKYSRDTVMNLRNSDIKLEMAQESSGEDDDSLSDEGSSSMPLD